MTAELAHLPVQQAAPTTSRTNPSRTTMSRPAAEPGESGEPGEPPGSRRRSVRGHVVRVIAGALPVVSVLGIAAFVRLHSLDTVGFNSDEAVYAGTAASMLGDQGLQGMFPVFRAHPLLFQALVSLAYTHGVSDWGARAVAALIGVFAVLTTYLLGRRLYGRVAATVAALLMAVMPYPAVVSRQVLLDGLVVPFATLVLYCVARYCEQTSARWLAAAGAMTGLAVLSKETSLVLIGGLYAFFAVNAGVRVKLRHVGLGAAMVTVIAMAFPLVVRVSGRTSTGSNYFLWQLSRRPNHPSLFYAEVLPEAIGVGVLVTAAVGLLWLRRRGTWREPLLMWWIAVPVIFFTLWPVKGYQYLLPIAPAVAVLAARTVVHLATIPALATHRLLRRGVVAGAALSLASLLAVPTWGLINPATSGTFLAGTGGVPGGREAGAWVREHAPQGAQLLAVGPSMANILEFYGRHRVYGLSVSADPRARNPSYSPVPNADRWIRDDRVQYLVWDSYSAARTPFFTQKLRDLVNKYHAVAVYTATVDAPTGERLRDGSVATSAQPVVIIYQVWPS